MIRFFGGISKAFFFACLGAFLVHQFLFEPYRVSDSSMAPQYKKGDILIVLRYPYVAGTPKRNEVFLFRSSDDTHVRVLRQIVGLPGEYVRVSENILNVKDESGVPILSKELAIFSNLASSAKNIGRLDPHEYFVLSSESVAKYSGNTDENLIVGKPIFRLYPLLRFGLIK